MDILLSILSAVLLAGTAVAYRRGRAVLFLALGAAFMLAAGAATVALYWEADPRSAVMLLALGIGLPLLGLALYVVDRNWAPFRLHMTYALRLCWVLWSALVLFNLGVVTIGVLFRMFYSSWI